MEYREYFDECWLKVGDNVITDEYYLRNQELLEAITYDFYFIWERSNAMPPSVAAQAIRVLLGNLTKFGIR